MYNKYLKYKQKYLNLLNLKAQLTGGGAYYDNSYLTINIINNIILKNTEEEKQIEFKKILTPDFETKNVMIFKPQTEEQDIIFSLNTKWCIVTNNCNIEYIDKKKM